VGERWLVSHGRHHKTTQRPINAAWLDPWPHDTDGWPYVPRHTSDWVPPTWDEWIMGVPPGWLADGVA
jgi:hypothetical protein